ncbi:DUF3325 domain-containing protein [Novosphingobium sp. M1R2S20]|uniref:DUF3325 domain-containing protein n=1 Tax=Novosphingobium rhizovicinum TaxID=3228928 RepID=A0ABV3RFT2_9SPHN
MSVLALAAALLAFVLLGLSTDMHHSRHLQGRPAPRRKRGMRGAAWSSLVAALLMSVAARGWVFGPILWFGLVMLSAGIVFLCLNFVPASGASPRPKTRPPVSHR